MRLTIPACAILLAACASGGPGLAHEAPIRVSLSELRLDTVAGRAALRERVAHTARAYCTAQAAAFAPYEARWDPFYCTDMLRSWIVGGMSPDIRKAYAMARREAGVRGRRL
nr:UrcA family protein [uncultured Sphingomonas sp.]